MNAFVGVQWYVLSEEVWFEMFTLIYDPMLTKTKTKFLENQKFLFKKNDWDIMGR